MQVDVAPLAIVAVKVTSAPDVSPEVISNVGESSAVELSFFVPKSEPDDKTGVAGVEGKFGTIAEVFSE